MMPAALAELGRRWSPRTLAALAVCAAVVANLPDQLEAVQRSALAERFRFTALPFPDPAHARARSIREVNPSVRHIDAWISSVGAAVALNDLDGNGRDDDACLVDPRYDTVTVQPVPGTERRYAPRTLTPDPLPYDARTMAPMGCLPLEADGDGRMDVLVYYWGRTPVLLLRRGAGYRPRELIPGGGIWNTNAATVADVDGDGHADIVIGNYFRDGDRVLDARSPDPIAMQDSMSRAVNGGVNRILLRTGPGRYREARGALTPDVARGWTLAVGAQDLDGDLRPELYFANDFGSDRLLYNRSRPGRVSLRPAEGTKSFSDASSKVLGHDSFKGMGIDFGDLNGDERPDMLVSNIAATFGLMESNFAWISQGSGYVDRSEPLGLARSGWGWDARLDDFDADGTLEALQAAGFIRGHTNRWPELQELAIANDDLLDHPTRWPHFRAGTDISGDDRDAFYVLGPDGRYHDLGTEVGFAPGRVSRGIATADVDRDGRLDFAVAGQWQRSSVYLNRCEGRCRASLGLELRLPDGSPAIGAQATVVRHDGRRLVRQVDGGNGHSGKRSNDLLFGLSGDRRAVPVDVRWRDLDGRRRHLTTTLAPGWHTLVLRDGTGRTG
jgi:enediyne biosynthesis protein E4